MGICDLILILIKKYICENNSALFLNNMLNTNWFMVD